MAARAPATEPLTSEDLAILRAESPTVAGHILKVTIVGPDAGGARPDLDAVRARVEERIERAPRLRWKLRMRGRRAADWVDDAAFDVREHVLATPVAGPGAHDGLHSACARAMEERLDRSRPLWRVEVLEPLEDGGVAVILKIHHSLADGATALRLLRDVLWDPAGEGAGGAAGAESPAPLGGLHEALRARRPGRLPGALRREFSRSRDPSPLDGAIGSSRSVAFAAVPLGVVRRAAKELVPGATVNDAVLALVAGALRRWEEGRGDPIGPLRVKVPVSLHQRNESAVVGNRDSFFCTPLPLDEPDPVERLRRIHADTALCKRSGDPLVLDVLFRDLGRVAPPLRRMLERVTLDPRAFALNVSNVAGPAERPRVLGVPVRALYTVAEIRERHGLRVAVISMADELSFGLCADPALVGDLRPLAAGISAEAAELGERAG